MKFEGNMSLNPCYSLSSPLGQSVEINNNEPTQNNPAIKERDEKINGLAIPTISENIPETVALECPIPEKPSLKVGNEQKLVGRVALGALALLTVIGSGLSANFFWLGQSTSNRPAPGDLDNTCPINEICPNTFSFRGNMSCDLFDYNTLQLNIDSPLTPFKNEKQQEKQKEEHEAKSFLQDCYEGLQRESQELQKMSQESIQRSQNEISASLERKQVLETSIGQWELEIAEKQREITSLSSGKTLIPIVKYTPTLEDEIEIIPTNRIAAEGDITPADKVRMKIVARDFQGEGNLLYEKKVYRDEYSRKQLVEFLTDQGFEIQGLEYAEGIIARKGSEKMTVVRDSSHADMWYFSMPWKSGTPLPSIELRVFHFNSDINESNVIVLESEILRRNRMINSAKDEIKDLEDRIKREEAEIAFNQKSLGKLV